MCPVPLRVYPEMSCVMGSCLARAHRSLLSVISAHLIFRMSRRQLLRRTCTLLDSLEFACLVLDPYSSTALTLMIKILCLFLVMKMVDFHTGFTVLKACFAFSCGALMPSAAPFVVDMMVSMCENVSTFFHLFSLRSDVLFLSVVYLHRLCLSTVTRSPVTAGLSASRSVLGCLC